MPRTRYLSIQFDQPLLPHEIPKFRAAVIEKTNRVASLFHNHVTDKEVIYRYPLIQYKTTCQKASMICLEQGADDIHHLLQQQDLSLRIGSRTKKFEVEAVDLRYHRIEIADRIFDYKLRNWLPLNQKNYVDWQQFRQDPFRRGRLLNKILCGNILSLAKGIDWHVEDRILANIEQVDSTKDIIYKGVEMEAFDVQFRTNVWLPNYVGLGRGASIGFGVVKRLINHNI